jgi:DNA-binding NtrC family response regulator
LFLPSLRHRQGDVEALFWHFVEEMNQRGPRRIEGVTRPAIDAILSYPWPGNVRELHSAVECAFVVGEGPLLDIADLAPDLRSERPPGTPTETLADAERERILAALARHKGRKAAAADELGISRSTLWRKLYAHRLR